jgi:hypothetical protein
MKQPIRLSILVIALCFTTAFAEPNPKVQEILRKQEARLEQFEKEKQGRDRANAFSDLIQAYQKIARDEDYISQYENIILSEPSASEIAISQAEIIEIRNEIRAQQAAIESISKTLNELSRADDPSWELAIAIYLVDIANARNEYAQAKREKAENEPYLKEVYANILRATEEQVMAREYTVPESK